MNIIVSNVKSILNELLCNVAVVDILTHCNHIDVWQLVGCIVCDSVQLLVWHDQTNHKNLQYSEKNNENNIVHEDVMAFITQNALTITWYIVKAFVLL